MALYKYKAISDKGQVLEGYQEAASEYDVVKMLKNNNYYPVAVKEDEDIDRGKHFFVKKVKKKDLAVFCRQFYTMLNAGISIVNCLDILGKQMENKTLQIAVISLCEDVQKGLTLSEGMKKQKDIFPPLLIHMVEAGEVSGNLDLLIERMAIHYEKENKIENKVKNALIYPVVLSIVSIAVVMFLIVVVMPIFISMFDSSGYVLPTPTRVILYIGNWISNYWYILFIGLFILIIGIKYIKSVPKGRLLIDRLKISIPIINKVNIKIATSRFTRTLSTLLSSGIPMLQSLEIVKKVVGNSVISEKLEYVKEGIRKGVPLSKAIKDMKVFPPMVDSMIRIGEESGSLDTILYKTADYYDEEVESSMQKMTTLLEPMLIVFMAVIIGFIVISMTMPMFDMFNTLQI